MRIPLFTRVWVVLAIVVVRFAPLLALAVQSRTHDVSRQAWPIALAWTLALQVVFYFVGRKCSGEHFGYSRGLLFIGAAMSTGWLYFDAVLVFCVVVIAQLLAVFIAPMADASRRFFALVHVFYRHRMQR